MQQHIPDSSFGAGYRCRMRLLAGIVLMLFIAVRLTAQCERVGWVVDATPGCGARIIDLNNAELLRAVAGADQLHAGATIRFSAEPAALPAGCPVDAYTAVHLTCSSDTLPCEAQFGYAVTQANAYRLLFEADIYDPSVQFCSWTFGDGATATGSVVRHTFPHDGYFEVCLTVTDAFGCSAQQCRNVFVSDQNPNWCGYDVQLTAVGARLFGKIFPVASNAGILQSIRWFDNKTNALLSEEAEFSTMLPGEGTYSICAQYEVANVKDGSICTTTRCQTLTLATPDCLNPAMVNTGAICPSFFAPVCACSGVTYANECAAMAAGVSKWWAGECGIAPSGSCATDLDFEVISGSPNSGYQVRFRNLASGDFSNVQLDFGDGTSIWQGGPQDTVCEHHYSNGGVFRTNLTAWKSNTCVSSVTKLLVTDAFNMSADHLPAVTDYVLPGDANGDKKANVYDLLNLGLGFATTGAPRPFATTAWTPQFAPNWPVATHAGVNFKHLDGDGNGSVNDFDRNPIEQHYSPIDASKSWSSGTYGTPRVWVRFAQDTLYVDPANPAPLQIEGDIWVGSHSKPALNLYGLAFALKYPEYVNHDPEVFYSSSSFLGFPTDILLMQKDIHDQQQLDMGFARKYGQPVSGYGSIAKVNFTTDFIIIIDIIERSGEQNIAFTIPVGGLQAIDADGNVLDFEGVVRDTLWLNLRETTNTEGSALEQRAVLYPNPASDGAMLVTGNLAVEHIDIFNALGQPIHTTVSPGDRMTRIDTRYWPNGLYTLQIRTTEGVLKKRLLVQH